MNRGEMVEMVQNLFGDTSEAQVTKNFIISQLDRAQIDIARRTKYLVARAETDVVVGVDGYELPEDFLQLESITLAGRSIPRVGRATLDSLDSHRALNENSTPFAYFVRGRTLFLNSGPSVAEVSGLDIWYIKKPAKLEEDADIPEIPETMHDSMVQYALARCKELDEEYQQAQVIWANYFEQIIEAKDEVFDDNAESYPSIRLLPSDY